MQLTKAFAISLLLASHYSIATESEPVRSTIHPVIGYWKAIVPETTCVESYLFNADGTAIFTSGNEQSEVNYEVAQQPDINGFFKLTHTVLKTNGGKDCTNEVPEVRVKTISYLLFKPDGTAFVSCDTESETMELCFGPMQLESNKQSD